MRRERWLRSHSVRALIITASILVLSIPASFVSAQTTATYPKALRLVTLSPGTSLYAISSGLAKVASDKTPMTLMVVPTSGIGAWPSMLTELESADLVCNSLNVFWQMWTGKVAPEPMPKGLPPESLFRGSKGIRILAAGPSMPTGMLVRKDSEMREVADLRGKIIAWGWSANPALLSQTLANLYNGGLTLDDVKTMPITEVVAGVRAVQEKRIDATFCAVGMGAVAEADTLVGVRFLRNSMDPERIKEGQRCTPGAYPTIVRAGQPGVREDTPIWSFPLGVLVSTRMTDHVAYKLVETWWTYHKEYASIHPLLKEWTPETFVNKDFTAPYHNGAIQFYKEKGVWSPEMEVKQNQLLK